MARPRLELDEDQIEKLAAIMCTMEEIASVVECSVDTLERRYAEVIKRGRERGKMSLKRKQYETAMKGNVSMLIWLGKQHLGQRDKSKDEIDAMMKVSQATRPIQEITKEQIADLIKAAREGK
jgi:hypothetical protein